MKFNKQQAFKEDVTHEKETEAMMNELEDFREKVIDNTEIWLSAADGDNKVVLWNPACERLSGYSALEVIGKKNIWSELLYESNDLLGTLELKASTESNSAINTCIITKTGEKKFISLTRKKL